MGRRKKYKKGKNKHKMYPTTKFASKKEDEVFEPLNYRYLNPAQLQERCFMSIADYQKEGVAHQTKDGVYYYQDNGSNVLAVAHLDTVQQLRKFVVTQGGRKIYNPQLDDRLGAYTILDLLPSLGLKYDILLTEGEETGNTTAAHFVLPEGKEYLWMMEVDRMGTDTVCYKYENDKLVKRLQSVGCRVGVGSFTDISALGHLGCQGMNFGCGYYNNHSTEAYFMVEEFEAQVDRIIQFYEKYKDTKLEYDPKTCGRKSYHVQTYYSRDWDSYSSKYICGKCNITPCQCSKTAVVQYCKYCGDLKFGRYCEAYCEMFESQCQVCEDVNCLGLRVCEICNYLLHSDPFLDKFSSCRECLQYFTRVPEDLLNAYELNRSEANINNIKEYTYQ